MIFWLILAALVAAAAALILTLGILIGKAAQLGDRIERVEGRLDELALQLYPDDDEDSR